ncbi:unnamed protein product [Adineta steineri]|uniref:TIR domain-containing protein n=1 Tax=Adineta steineri TaxID=433720 RepID=A0A819QDA6_9BILA|nr:unnamed protein product [Adineta steineri]CAF4029525.1 unnamed protein product [Adineta steineri]
MISYCWAEKKLCKDIFEKLKSKDYRIWFDERQMHGNSLTAMASAIENSECIIICMSENYQKSNACHHEAEYAYVRQRRIVPLVVQPKYKAQGWLGFIIGAKIYVDFTKTEFDKAFDMLEGEMKYDEKAVESMTPMNTSKSDDKKIESKKKDDIRTQPTVDPTENKVDTKRTISTMHENKRINEWTSDDVISWCHIHNLLIFSRLLEHYDGSNLLRLYNISKTNGDNETFRLLQDDCQRIAGNNQIKLTFTEFVRFQSELDKIIEREMQSNKPPSEKTTKSAKSCLLL